MQLKETSRTRNLEKAWRPRQKSTNIKTDSVYKQITLENTSNRVDLKKH